MFFCVVVTRHAGCQYEVSCVQLDLHWAAFICTFSNSSMSLPTLLCLLQRSIEKPLQRNLFHFISTIGKSNRPPSLLPLAYCDCRFSPIVTLGDMIDFEGHFSIFSNARRSVLHTNILRGVPVWGCYYILSITYVRYLDISY